MAELLEVPILKGGEHKGFAINDLRAAAQDTMKAMPLLLEAQFNGTYRGESNARFNDEIPPAFINLQHDVIDGQDTAAISPERLKELSTGIQFELDTRLYNGEEWVVGNFRNVNPDLAQLLSAGYPGRSAEILPEFENPDTGEIYPAVIRSVAFLDARTKPAVPQYPGYSVKLALNELGVQVVSCEIPKINNQKKETTMPNEEGKTVKLSQEDIQRFEAMESRLKTLESENNVLKGAVNEVQEQKEHLASKVLKFQADAHDSKIAAYCMKLEKENNLTKAAIDTIRPVLQAQGGVVKMSADAEPVPVEKAYMESIETIIKLAAEKDALFIPVAANIASGKQPVKKLSAFEAQEAEIKKLQADAKEKGQDMSYADARLQVVKLSNSVLDRIEQAKSEEEGA